MMHTKYTERKRKPVRSNRNERLLRHGSGSWAEREREKEKERERRKPISSASILISVPPYARQMEREALDTLNCTYERIIG